MTAQQNRESTIMFGKKESTQTKEYVETDREWKTGITRYNMERSEKESKEHNWIIKVDGNIGKGLQWGYPGVAILYSLSIILKN